MSNPKKNFVYNILYQILTIIIPLITAPYLARVVGAEGVGIYSYTYSIVYYFMIFTLLGVNNYGNRAIAKVRDDKQKLSRTFWEIYLLQIFMGIIMLVIYSIYLYNFNVKYKQIAIIQTFYIISAILDINWLFFGLEEFKKTITRNIIVKLGNIILIFLLVKRKEDLWIYTSIMAGMTCIGQLVLWNFIKNKIQVVKIVFKDIVKHIKPNIVLFIPVIAVSLYKIMDKIMLGKFTDVIEVGYYENAEKIINIPITLITALGTVMLPRISNIVANGKNHEVKQYINKSIEFLMFISFPMCCGLIGIGYKFAPLYFGYEFQKTGILIMLLALTLPFMSFANVIRTQYLIPMEKDKIYIVSVTIGAIANLFFNIILIPKFKSIGACVGTIIAEMSVMIFQTFSVRNDLSISNYIKKNMHYLLKAVIMLCFIYPLNYIYINEYLRLIIQIILGMIIYSLLNLKYIIINIDAKNLMNKFIYKK